MVASRRSIIILTTLLIVIFPLLLLPLLIALLGLEFLFPEPVGGVLVQVREDEAEDLRVPFDGVAGDAFFDVLRSLAWGHSGVDDDRLRMVCDLRPMAYR